MNQYIKTGIISIYKLYLYKMSRQHQFSFSFSQNNQPAEFVPVDIPVDVHKQSNLQWNINYSFTDPINATSLENQSNEFQATQSVQGPRRSAEQTFPQMRHNGENLHLKKKFVYSRDQQLQRNGSRANSRNRLDYGYNGYGRQSENIQVDVNNISFFNFTQGHSQISQSTLNQDSQFYPVQNISSFNILVKQEGQDSNSYTSQMTFLNMTPQDTQSQIQLQNITDLSQIQYETQSRNNTIESNAQLNTRVNNLDTRVNEFEYNYFFRNKKSLSNMVINELIEVSKEISKEQPPKQVQLLGEEAIQIWWIIVKMLGQMINDKNFSNIMMQMLQIMIFRNQSSLQQVQHTPWVEHSQSSFSNIFAFCKQMARKIRQLQLIALKDFKKFFKKPQMICQILISLMATLLKKFMKNNTTELTVLNNVQLQSKDQQFLSMVRSFMLEPLIQLMIKDNHKSFNLSNSKSSFIAMYQIGIPKILREFFKIDEDLRAAQSSDQDIQFYHIMQLLDTDHYLKTIFKTIRSSNQ